MHFQEVIKMIKYLIFNFVGLGMVILVLGFVNPGKVSAMEIQPACGVNRLAPELYLKVALEHISQGIERLKAISNPAPVDVGGDPQFMSHSQGFAFAGERLVKTYQQVSCGIIKTLNETLPGRSEIALQDAAHDLIRATTADYKYIREVYMVPEKTHPDLYKERYSMLEMAKNTFSKVYSEISLYRDILLGRCPKGCPDTVR